MLARRLGASAAIPAPNGIVVERIEDLMRVNGQDAESADGANLSFGFGQGGVSRARFRTHDDLVWVATCQVSLADPGELLPCKFGAVFQDDTGRIVKWWHSPAVHFENNQPMRLRFEAPSPAGASWVRLGMMGPWSDNRKSTATYVYTHCQLEPLLAAAGQRTEQ